MEDKKTIFDYLGQLFATYGITVAIFIVFGMVVGEGAREFSTLFALGNSDAGTAAFAGAYNYGCSDFIFDRQMGQKYADAFSKCLLLWMYLCGDGSVCGAFCMVSDR